MKENRHMIHHLPKDERPYEKCRRLGADRLSETELLAILLRTGTSQQDVLELADRILHFSDEKCGLDGLLKLSYRDLTSIPGIGCVKAVQILAVIELSGRLARAALPKRREFLSAESVGSYYASVMRGYRQEHVILVFLDAKNRMIGEYVLSKGTILSAQADPREIFIEAVRREAVSIILVHNHPSGDPTPSQADLRLTHRVREAGDILGIPLKDHVIVGGDHYRSLYADGIFC